MPSREQTFWKSGSAEGKMKWQLMHMILFKTPEAGPQSMMMKSKLFSDAILFIRARKAPIQPTWECVPVRRDYK